MNPAYREDYELAQRLASAEETVRRAAEQEFAARLRDDLWRALLFWCADRNVTCRIERESACARVFRRAPSPEDVPATATEKLPECDELGRMWVFLVNTSLVRVRRYRGEAPLCHFLAALLYERWLYQDYVRQQKGRVEIPKALEDASPEVQSVYRYLRWRYSDEDIALRLVASVEEARRWRGEVEDRLKQSGQYWELLGGRPRDEESLTIADEEEGESTEVDVVDEAQPDLDTQVLIRNLQAALRRIIARLPEADREVLDGLYRQGQTAREITEAWQKSGRSFAPGETVTQAQIESSVRRSMRTIVRELPAELAYFVSEDDVKQMKQVLVDPKKQQAFIETLKEYLRLGEV